MYLAILGYITLVVFVILLFREKSTPAIVLAALPVVTALVAGYDIWTIEEYVSEGMQSVTGNAVLFCFAILFFTIESDAGLFKPIIRALMRVMGKSLSGICVAVVLIALVGHLDGSATTTILITLPFFAPVFKRLNLDPRALVFLIGTTMGVMNLTPWAGTLLRVSVATGLDINYLWQQILPMQLTALALVIVFAVLYSVRAKKQCRMELSAVMWQDEEGQEPVTWRFWANLVLTVAAIAVLAVSGYTSYMVFMAAAIIALIINYGDNKSQAEVIRKGAPGAFFIIITILASGVFIGIMGGGEQSILSSMSEALLRLVPGSLLKHLPLILGILGVPLGLLFSGDALMYGVLPLCAQMGAAVGVAAEDIGLVMAVGDSLSIIGSPVYPATYLILGLAGVELRDYLKYAIIPMWLISILMILSGAVSGVITL